MTQAPQRRPALAHWPAAWRFPSGRPVEAAGRAMVVSADGYASRAGAEVLAAGGNALDATVATAFALAVVNPEAGNLGGSGFLVLRTAGGERAALDHRSTAPAAATRDMFLDGRGGVSEDALIGHRSVGVPGTVLGLWEAHRRYGSLPWAHLLEPAIRLAAGFVVRPNFLHSFTPNVIAGLGRFPESARIFLPGGAPPRVGERFSQPELGRTLERIRDSGPAGFYEGETARLLLGEMERGGGILAAEDLASYRALWREPVSFAYRGHTVVSMPPSSSGGVTLAATAAVLEALPPLADLPWHGAEHVHLLAEAWRRAYADRNHYLADPDLVPQPLETLTARAYGAWRARDVSARRATPSAEVLPGVEAFLRRAGAAAGATPPPEPPPPPREGQHTTHVSVVDAQGNAVALTTTINSWYGAKVTVTGAGFLLNNEMDDFAALPGAPNQFGLVQGEANAIAPGKRMLSAMTPSLVLDEAERLLLVVGSPGGSTIITTVFQVVSRLLDHGLTLADAVLAPRVHHQHLPDQIFWEPAGLDAEVTRELQEMGHTLHERPEPSGDVQAVRVRRDGTLEGQSDPRRGGAAAPG